MYYCVLFDLAAAAFVSAHVVSALFVYPFHSICLLCVWLVISCFDVVLFCVYPFHIISALGRAVVRWCANGITPVRTWASLHWTVCYWRLQSFCFVPGGPMASSSTQILPTKIFKDLWRIWTWPGTGPNKSTNMEIVHPEVIKANQLLVLSRQRIDILRGACRRASTKTTPLGARLRHVADATFEENMC